MKFRCMYICILSAANIFRFVFLGVQINPIFSIYVCILYLSCNVKKTKITDKMWLRKS